MTRARAIIWTRVAVISGAVCLIELLCRLGVIKPLTMTAPSQMALDLGRMIASGEGTVAASPHFGQFTRRPAAREGILIFLPHCGQRNLIGIATGRRSLAADF